MTVQAAAAASSDVPSGVDWTFLHDNAHTIAGWFAWHAWLAVIPVVIGLVVALPIGWVMNRYRWTYPPLVSIAGVLYTIPSIALFVVLPGLLHTKVLAPINVVVALSIYTVALMVRVIADGLASVPTEVAQAATAMGFKGPSGWSGSSCRSPYRSSRPGCGWRPWPTSAWSRWLR